MIIAAPKLNRSLMPVLGVKTILGSMLSVRNREIVSPNADQRALLDAVKEQCYTGREHRELFPLEDVRNQPMAKTQFYSWLTVYEPKGNHNTIGSIMGYLLWLGFDLKKHYIEPEDHRALRYILDVHWTHNHREAAIMRLQAEQEEQNQCC